MMMVIDDDDVLKLGLFPSILARGHRTGRIIFGGRKTNKYWYAVRART